MQPDPAEDLLRALRQIAALGESRVVGNGDYALAITESNADYEEMNELLKRILKATLEATK